jgi:hypothetical protein
MLVVIFDPEDGGHMFLQNVSCLSVDCMVLIPEDGTLPFTKLAGIVVKR